MDRIIARVPLTLGLRCSWLYLVFFNGLWVIIPLWFLYEAYQAMAVQFAAGTSASKKKK